MVDELAEMTVCSTQAGRDMTSKTQEDLATFSDLLDSIDTVDPRLKLLWKQIYENALVDRRNAYVIWMDLLMVVHGNPEQHVIHGDHLAKYLERMSKSADQMLKLAELVYKAKDKQEAEQLPTGNALFDVLEKSKRR